MTATTEARNFLRARRTQIAVEEIRAALEAGGRVTIVVPDAAARVQFLAMFKKSEQVVFVEQATWEEVQRG